jgi:hypothetical protein
MSSTADNRLEQLMKDADLSNLGQADYFKYLKLLRCEWEALLQ